MASWQNSPFAGAQIDFSPLMQIGENIGKGVQRRRLRDAVAGARGPDGSLDWDAAIGRVLEHDPELGLRLSAQRAEAEALSAYRRESLKPDMIREYEYMYGGQGGQSPQMPGGQPQPEGMQPQQGGAPSVSDYMSNRRGGSTAEKAVDTAYGKDYADWRAGGGFAGVKKQIGQLGDAATRLESGENITGPFIGQIPESLMPMFNPAGREVGAQVEEAIQSSLRQVLGAQYTEKEGQNLLRRTWDPTLDDATNAQRVRRVLTQLQEMAQAKEAAAAYYEANGTLRGYRGPTISADALNPDMPALTESNQTVVPRMGGQPQSAFAPAQINFGGAQPEARFRTQNNPQGLPPTEENVQALKQMANDPQAIQTFDEHFGQGAAEWFLQGGR